MPVFQIEELKFELDEQKKISCVKQDNENQVKDLTQKLSELKIQLKEAERKHDEPTQELDFVKKEIEHLKVMFCYFEILKPR